MEHKVCILTIGDELLIGQVIDTNSAWMGENLRLAGYDVGYKAAVSDHLEEIKKAVDFGLKHYSIVLLTGGLGPTKDDITKHALCEYFKTELNLNAGVLAHIQSIFEKRGREMNALSRMQAFVPAGSTVLFNESGTAPGIWIETQGKVVVAMPGVPGEMKKMMTGEVIPRIQNRFPATAQHHLSFLTCGIGESVLATMIEDWENELPDFLKLAYLPTIGMVRLRLTGSGPDKTTLQNTIKEKFLPLEKLLEPFWFGYDQDTLEGVCGKLLMEKKQTLGIAESCTGGALASAITRIPGCSEYFFGSLVAYANEVKSNILGVAEETIQQHGAVSRETAKEMAEHAVRFFNSDCSIGISGIAGPGGEVPGKPLGTVFISIKTPLGLTEGQFMFGGGRLNVITQSVQTALNLLRRELLKG